MQGWIRLIWTQGWKPNRILICFTFPPVQYFFLFYCCLDSSAICNGHPSGHQGDGQSGGSQYQSRRHQLGATEGWQQRHKECLECTQQSFSPIRDCLVDSTIEVSRHQVHCRLCIQPPSFLGVGRHHSADVTPQWRTDLDGLRAHVVRCRLDGACGVVRRTGFDVCVRQALNLALLMSQRDPVVGAQYRWTARLAPSSGPPAFWGLLQGEPMSSDRAVSWLTRKGWLTVRREKPTHWSFQSVDFGRFLPGLLDAPPCPSFWQG